MTMNNPQLVKCEQCYQEGKTVYLGSLSSQGAFLIRNNHSGHAKTSYTAIMSESFTMIHDCGFTIKVESGIIISELASPILNG